MITITKDVIPNFAIFYACCLVVNYMFIIIFLLYVVFCVFLTFHREKLCSILFCYTRPSLKGSNVLLVHHIEINGKQSIS